MSSDSMMWLILPMLFIIAAAAIRPKIKPSMRSTLVGIILSAILVAFYIIVRP